MDTQNMIEGNNSIDPSGEEKKSQMKKDFLRFGIAMTVFFLLAQLVPTGVVYLLKKFCNSFAQDNKVWINILLSFVPLYGIAFPAFMLILKKMPSWSVPKEKVKRIPFSNFICILIISFSAMYLANMVSVLVNMIIKATTGLSSEMPLDFLLDQNIWINLLTVGLLAPIFEELVFRKFIISKLIRYGEGLAILASGFVFGLFHANASQMLYAVVLGCIFAYVTVKTGTVLYSIALHAIVNIVGGVLMPYLVTMQNAPILIAVSVVAVTVIALGVTLLIINRKKIQINEDESYVNLETKYLWFFMNPGTVCYVLAVMAIIVKMSLTR